MIVQQQQRADCTIVSFNAYEPAGSGKGRGATAKVKFTGSRAIQGFQNTRIPARRILKYRDLRLVEQASRTWQASWS